MNLVDKAMKGFPALELSAMSTTHLHETQTMK